MKPDLESFSEALMVVLDEERRYSAGVEEAEPAHLPLVDGGGGGAAMGRAGGLPQASLGHRWVFRMRSGSGPTGDEVAQLDEVTGLEGPVCLGKLRGEAVVLWKERDPAGLEVFLGVGGAEAAGDAAAGEGLDARVMTVTKGPDQVRHREFREAVRLLTQTSWEGVAGGRPEDARLVSSLHRGERHPPAREAPVAHRHQARSRRSRSGRIRARHGGH